MCGITQRPAAESGQKKAPDCSGADPAGRFWGARRRQVADYCFFFWLFFTRAGSPASAACLDRGVDSPLLTSTLAGLFSTMNSTRRFWARPSSVSLLAIGLLSPAPVARRVEIGRASCRERG